MSLPFEEQESLFPTLPIDVAATLVENLPYVEPSRPEGSAPSSARRPTMETSRSCSGRRC
jgi:hypothetical protein